MKKYRLALFFAGMVLFYFTIYLIFGYSENLMFISYLSFVVFMFTIYALSRREARVKIIKKHPFIENLNWKITVQFESGEYRDLYCKLGMYSCISEGETGVMGYTKFGHIEYFNKD